MKVKEVCKDEPRYRRDCGDDRTVATMDTIETILTSDSGDSIPSVATSALCLSWEECKKIPSISLTKDTNAKSSLTLYVEETKRPKLSDPAGQARIAGLWKRLRENEEQLHVVDRTCQTSYDFLM